MVNWVFKEQGCTDLNAINELNENVRSVFLWMAMFMVNGLLLLILHLQEDYGDSPIRFVERMGLTKEEWKRTENHSATCGYHDSLFE